jgi:hypothetical protein
MREGKLGGWDAMLGRAVRDAEFREQLMSDPDAAAADYDLTKDQIADLKEVQADAARKFFESVASAEGELGLKAQRAKADWCTDKKCNDR